MIVNLKTFSKVLIEINIRYQSYSSWIINCTYVHPGKVIILSVHPLIQSGANLEF